MLDRERGMGFERPMRKTVSIKVEALRQQLVLQQKHCAELWGEMGAQEQEYVERMQVGAPVVQALKKYEHLREQYLEEDKQRVLLRGLMAKGGGEI
jgi:hypothetical protein